MNIFLVDGEHPAVPGNPYTAHATPEGAAARALELVNIIREEPLYDEDAAEYSLILPPLPADADWREGLREWQRAKIGDEAVSGPMDDAQLGEAAEAWVDIVELPLRDLPAADLANTHSLVIDTAGCDDPELIAAMADARPGPLMAMPAVRVAVGVNGGAVQWVLADGPGARVHIVDYDVDEHTDFDLTLVTDNSGDTSPANVYEEKVEIDPLYFARLDTSPTHINCDRDFYGEDDEDQKPNPRHWLIGADIGVPGPAGGIESYSGWVPGETAEAARKLAYEIIERRYGEGTRIFTMRTHRPEAA